MPAMSRFAQLVDTAPDAAFALIEQFKADPSPKKVDLSPGFYRDEYAKPWVLPSVRMVKICHCRPLFCSLRADYG